MIDTEQKVLVTSRSTKLPGQITGRSENNRIVSFEGPDSLIGQMVTVKITSGSANSLHGHVLIRSATVPSVI